jgi:hypothetical protein
MGKSYIDWPLFIAMLNKLPERIAGKYIIMVGTQLWNSGES